ncbi:stage II sporulation protein M [Clostridium sp. P21]|uniref:Stage II sporulation protein M n=1 Tax=Clostridium muellerianum TaxID=2716538 RepID=A0A7Y0EMB6_9CLOT|nr:stage II sporulation protein M [Clostridium muellerianum]NMM66021.1 stage II sporulation protein M [Clostridium muellerianum]
MKEDQFINTHLSTWKELEQFTTIINNKGIKSLSSKEVQRFLYAFRQSSHHLAYARTHYSKSNVVEYLNSLISKCHSHIYTVKKISSGDFTKYIRYDFPKFIKEYRWFVIGAFGFFIIGFLVSLLMVLHNVDNSNIFLPSNLVENIKEGKSGGGQWNYPLMSSYIMTNNIAVSLKVFVLGVTLGLGTIYVLFFNGAMLGSLTAVTYLYGNPTNYWSLILPHGIIELTAIFISGAAGLIIAKSILIPGEYSRKSSLINGAKKASSLILGVILMLIIAGIIEGFFTPLKISAAIKLSFATITAVILMLYFSTAYLKTNTKKV